MTEIKYDINSKHISLLHNITLWQEMYHIEIIKFNNFFIFYTIITIILIKNAFIILRPDILVISLLLLKYNIYDNKL